MSVNDFFLFLVKWQLIGLYRFCIWFDISWSGSVNNISYKSKFMSARFEVGLKNIIAGTLYIPCTGSSTLSDKYFFDSVHENLMECALSSVNISSLSKHSYNLSFLCFDLVSLTN